jgi:hypothetical protein
MNELNETKRNEAIVQHHSKKIQSFEIKQDSHREKEKILVSNVVNIQT